MRILLISPNEELLPDPVFPLGLACLAGALETAGHSYRVFDLCAEPATSEANLANVVREFDPQAIGISLRNVDNVAFPHSTSYFPLYADLCRTLRQLTVKPLIVGGAGFSLFAGQLMEELDADFGVVGSGEEPFLALLSALERKNSITNIPNLLYRDNGKLVSTPRQGLRLPDTLPSRRGFPQQIYYELGGMANVQTKRGCSFGCVYCSYPLIEGKVTKTRPVPEVLAELEGLVSGGYNEIYFVDSVFNFPPDYAKDLCRAIIAAGLSIRWTCYGSPLAIDAEMIDLFVRSGCIGIEFGTDALSPATLMSMGKSFTVEEAENASRLCAERGLPFCHAILAGGPGETEATFHETVDRLGRLGPTAVVFMTGIRIIPGTRLYETALTEGIITETTDMLEPVFYLAEAIRPFLDQEISRLARLHKNWIFPGHSIRSSPLLAKKLRQQGARGPLWLNLAGKNH